MAEHPVPTLLPQHVSRSTSIKRSKIKDAAFILLISAALLIPCFWHPRIEAGDLASHTYNAWLTTLVARGKAPGLWIAPQHNNVLFDILLFHLCSAFGFVTGEKLATAIAILCFFWGAFVLTHAVNGQENWFLVPLLMMLAYGWTAEMGFFNFYLSLAISFFALAVVWNARGIEWLLILPLLPLIWTAHPLGFFWFVAAALYVSLTRLVPTRRHWLLAALAIVALLGLRTFLISRFMVSWPALRVYQLNGTDQLILEWRDRFLPWLLILSAIVCVALQACQKLRGKNKKESEDPKGKVIAIQLYLLGWIAVMLLPDGLILPQYADPVLFIDLRFTLAVAVVGCAALASVTRVSRLFFALSTAAIAVPFFLFLYIETGHVYSMEVQAKGLVQHVPQGGRIISTLFPMQRSRVFSHHVGARACIGHCFVIDNYEAGTNQFRLRGNAGNRFVTTDPGVTSAMMGGIYTVRPEDLPLWQLFQCGPSEVDLCLRPLKAGPLQGTADRPQR